MPSYHHHVSSSFVKFIPVLSFWHCFKVNFNTNFTKHLGCCFSNFCIINITIVWSHHCNFKTTRIACFFHESFGFIKIKSWFKAIFVSYITYRTLLGCNGCCSFHDFFHNTCIVNSITDCISNPGIFKGFNSILIHLERNDTSAIKGNQINFRIRLNSFKICRRNRRNKINITG